MKNKKMKWHVKSFWNGDAGNISIIFRGNYSDKDFILRTESEYLAKKVRTLLNK
jgi:hypothetical protein